MDRVDLYKDIAERTQGDIYIGVVGPVRTGKSTFIKKFMDMLVVPNIENEHVRMRVIDELPQSGAGKTIMTTQPKFVPNEAVKIELGDKAQLNVRMVDCVGYMIKGALGHMEAEVPRMVRTPWSDEDMPFEEAAEMGTHKVITDHSTIGIVMTTDGSITDIPRSNYIEAEERVVNELKSNSKPFIIISIRQCRTMKIPLNCAPRLPRNMTLRYCALISWHYRHPILKKYSRAFCSSSRSK